MKISLQWLGRYVDLSTLSVAQIADALPMLGLEVESVSAVGMPTLTHVVVGEILSFEKHPKADRLSVCQVNTGDASPRQIVCGAKNFKAGDRVPVALPGAILPGNFQIKESKLRDVDSLGMMCSAKELGISEESDGLLILTARQLPIGSPINNHFPKPDTVFEIAVTANRGDALGHIGVARDLAAYFNKPLKMPTFATPPDAGKTAPITVNLTSPTCPYYTATCVSGVKIGPSPDWLRRDLEAVGLRALNNVVDITNWVLLETGQPLHAFDAAKIGGATINVRNASTGEKITLLDGKVIALDEADCVIADATAPLVIAGIMGGESSGVSDTTTDIVLESGWFAPAPVRKTSRRIAVSTDSSQRFTRDADPAMVAFAARRAIALILEIAGGQQTAPTLVRGTPPRGDRTIAISGDYVRERCGCDLPDATILDVFTRLGFASAPNPTANGWLVTVPSFRPEVDRPIDLVEEFVRIHGTESVPVAPITAPDSPATDAPVSLFTRKAISLMAGRGFAECWHYSFADGRDIETFHGPQIAAALALANPLTGDQTHMRASLLPGLLNALRLNLAGHNHPRRLFETGRVFRPGKTDDIPGDASAPAPLHELISVAFVMLAEPVAPTWKNREPADFFTAKKLALDVASLAGLDTERFVFKTANESPFWQAGHSASGKERNAWARDMLGLADITCGLVDARVTQKWDIKGQVVAGEILFRQRNFAKPPKHPRFEEWSVFPPVSRDIALVVDASMSAAEVLHVVRQAAQKEANTQFKVEDVTCFDVYAGNGLPDGKKSLAFTITYRAADKTLTDEDVNKAFTATITTLEKDKNKNFTVRAKT